MEYKHPGRGKVDCAYCGKWVDVVERWFLPSGASVLLCSTCHRKEKYKD